MVTDSSLRAPVPGVAARDGGDAAEVGAIVRAFYDRHPYPPPVDDLDRYRTRWTDERRRRLEFHLHWPRDAYRSNRSILVGGCGTTQAAKYAVRWPEAEVVGIDVSEASLTHAHSLKTRHGLDNLQLRQLPLERAGDLGRRFDHVVCTGVLHHLPDPERALAALAAVLAPGGTMHLMVYAPYGRAGLYQLQEYCRRIGLRPTPDDIDGLVASLRALPADHPFAALLRHAPDLQHRAGLADALLHPHDRPFSVPQLLALLAQGGLRLGRWVRQAPYLPHCGAIRGILHYSRLTSLAPADQYAALELFRGTMVRHSAVAVRDDDHAGSVPIDFEGDAWLDYVPIRDPDALTVSERLPPGAAAVLINPRHTYTDLYLPLGTRELALVNEIDGVRSIRALAHGTGEVDAVRRLFERLWWYDQVVFDASGSTRA